MTSQSLNTSLLRVFNRGCLACILIFAGTLLVRAQCPEETGAPNFVEGETYYVDIDVRFRNTPQGAQVRQAFEQWTQNNTFSNRSNITFQIITSWSQVPQGANLIHVSEEAFVDRFGAPNTSTAARLNPVRVEGTFLREATIFFNTSAETDPSDPSTGPFYDPTASGYDTVFKKATMHEIGHGMGLDHPSNQVSGGSVMNGRSNCPNDNCNFLPSSIKDCDNRVVDSVYAPPPPPPGCFDNDGDGFSTCDGDPDDYDPFFTPYTPTYAYDACVGYGCVRIDHYVIYPNGNTRFWYSEMVCQTWMLWC